jgi:hypothetical protein
VYEGGQKELRFNSNLVNSPVVVTTTIGSVTTGGLNISVKGTVWNGRPLLNLSYFDKTRKFFTAFTKQPKVVAECFRDGNRFFSGSVTLPPHRGHKPLEHLLKILDMARQVAANLKVNPDWCLTDDNWVSVLTNVEMSHAVLLGSGWEVSGEGYTISTSYSKDDVREMPLDEPSYEVTSYGEDWDFFGEIAMVGPLRYSLTNARLGVTKEEFAKRLGDGSDTVALSYVSTPSSVLTIRRIPEDDPDYLAACGTAPS